MKRIISTGFAILFAGCFVSAAAQDAPVVSTPAVADNASAIDNNIKLRSVELERIKREAEKSAVIRQENGTELNFSIIKEDFEGIQKSQRKIVLAYTMGDDIDHKAINSASNEITEMAVRLKGNVFAPETEESKSEGAPVEKKANPFRGESLRNLIVLLDNAIGKVVTNPMWQKLAVIDPEVSRQVEAELTKVVELSSALWIESGKLMEKK